MEYDSTKFFDISLIYTLRRTIMSLTNLAMTKIMRPVNQVSTI